MTILNPLVCVVDFHHARGPEVETWLGAEEGTDPAIDNDWSLLPFMALSDGAHASTEDYSYFTLRRAQTSTDPATSLFGISCTRQLDASKLIDRPAEVTRSTVQKAVVVISDSPQHFGAIKAQLGIVTQLWFAQNDFTDLDILQRFTESLPQLLKNQEGQQDHYFGISLREFIHEFKWQTLVLFKCALLQPKVLFFGSHCERLCMMQFALISLIPGLIRHLQDAADPKFNSCEEKCVMPTSLKTSERASLLAYMGLPLQLFGTGSLFGPYTPLQQLDILADQDTKSYIVGSTNSLLLQQRDRYSDILINLDDHTVNITSAALRSASVLSTPDRRWIDFLTQTVNDTWDDADPARPKDHGYAGSEEFIRMQFEEYLLAMLSSVKYKLYLEKNAHKEHLITEVEGNPASEFSNEWVHAWMQTENFRIWNKFTDSHLFDIVDPKHPCSGGLSMEDVQRRLAQQVAEMHLDERLEKSREALGKQLAVGQQKVSSAYNRLWAEMEAMREAQKQRAEEAKLLAEKEGKPVDDGKKCTYYRLPQTCTTISQLSMDSFNKNTKTGKTPQAPDLSTAKASAGAYFSSWGTWASEKRRTWGAAKTPVASPTPLDVKRAEDFKAEKEKTVGGVGTPGVPETPVAVDTPYQDDARRSSVFFDAENDRGESRGCSPVKERVVGLGLGLEGKRASKGDEKSVVEKN
ncbi:Avl9 multi-domain protein [Pyrenophora tritici-repentis]|nr:Avl9 multi-domain protein [Pyrenophora tritici-repentis]KAI1535998.1 Avl9 multi-domain protein [Pyrenophora tritici-repentis]PZC92259.1 Avl9 multi-domain protein [Pyrenophora tritici-repentis]PZD35582.1 Avl9 multi-domain protein [Pyrenophora tritici-repentis]